MTLASSTGSDDDPLPHQPRLYRAAAAAPLGTRRQVQVRLPDSSSLARSDGLQSLACDSGSGARSCASKGGVRAGSSSSTRLAETSQTKQKKRLPSTDEDDIEQEQERGQSQLSFYSSVLAQAKPG